MRNLLLFILGLIFILNAEAQLVTIPDANFVTFLQQNYPQCMNGNQMDVSCSAIVNETTINCSNKFISNLSGIEHFNNLNTLYCNQNQLTFLPALPASLTSLHVNYNQLTSLPTLPYGLLNLSCNYNQLTSLPALPPFLTSLSCQYNQLTNIPTLPSTLIGLDVYENLLTSLPALPNSLSSLQCAYNQLTSIPALPPGLGTFICAGNQISSLPFLPNTITTFICSQNQISNIPNLPSNLNLFSCHSNLLTSLPNLPNQLYYLDFGGNLFTSMPTLPNSLTKLYCYVNQITSLPSLPSGLLELGCWGNQITNLPTLPVTLKELFCDTNPLTVLPQLPISLVELTCSNTQITSLPELPDSLNKLWVNDNINLNCLPPLKKINNLKFYNTNIQCLSNYGMVPTSNPPLASVPLCDIFNPSSCDVFWNISGKVYSDSNSNCVSDFNELRLQNIKIQLYENGTLVQQVFSGAEGLYSFDTDTGVFMMTVDTTDLPIMVTCPTSGIHTSNLTPVDSMDYNMDFAMQCKPGFDIAVKNIARTYGQFFPGNNATIKIGAGDLANFYGLQCASGISGNVVVDFTGPVTFVSEAPGAMIPTVAGNILTYNITDFGMVSFYSDFMFILATDTTAQAGDQICFTVNVTPTSGDNNISNNTLQHCFTVVNSFDPNAKEVFPSENVSLNQEWLTYTIHFQNTGNAPAQNIYLLDTLDQNLIPSSFTLLSYSHELMLQVFDNVVRFNFPNINLPDSTNDEPNSHGYVQYKVKLNSGLPFGTIISNIAYNFFDFNPPVATNSVQISLGTVGIIENNPVIDFNVFPVPTSVEATISFTLEKPVEVKIELYNTLGQLVNTITRKKFPSGKNQINFTTENLFKGVYFIKFSIDENVEVKRLIKM